MTCLSSPYAVFKPSDWQLISQSSFNPHKVHRTVEKKIYKKASKKKSLSNNSKKNKQIESIQLSFA